MMIHYLFYLDYPIPMETEDKAESKQKTKKKLDRVEHQAKMDLDTTSKSDLHANVYAVAQKYDIDGLKIVAARKFKIALDANWTMENIIHAIQKVYKSTDEYDWGLKDVVVEIVSLMPKFLDNATFQEAIQDTDLPLQLLTLSDKTEKFSHCLILVTSRVKRIL